MSAQMEWHQSQSDVATSCWTYWGYTSQETTGMHGGTINLLHPNICVVFPRGEHQCTFIGVCVSNSVWHNLYIDASKMLIHDVGIWYKNIIQILCSNNGGSKVASWCWKTKAIWKPFQHFHTNLLARLRLWTQKHKIVDLANVQTLRKHHNYKNRSAHK